MAGGSNTSVALTCLAQRERHVHDVINEANVHPRLFPRICASPYASGLMPCRVWLLPDLPTSRYLKSLNPTVPDKPVLPLKISLWDVPVEMPVGVDHKGCFTVRATDPDSASGCARNAICRRSLPLIRTTCVKAHRALLKLPQVSC